MKKLSTIFILFALISSFSFINLFAQKNDVFINGYLRKDGSFVQPHFRTAPNRSMFDNYSTKGNFNPYTGKPGWIDPYLKISSTYSSAIPYDYKINYENIFVFLNKKDSYNYFKIVDAFDYQYKLFFTGLFKFNNNETKEANKIFNTLRKIKGVSNFIFEESNFWFDITSKYIDAENEFEDLYSSSAKYRIDGNYEALKIKLNSVKNPLNFYHKYLIKFTTDWHRHKYLEAKNSLDSLIVYSSQTEIQDSLIINYVAIVENLCNMQNTLDTYRNGTYYYDIEALVGNLRYFLLNKKTPIDDLKKACFKVVNNECTLNDSVFMRSLNDTSEGDHGNFKIDYLTFHTHASKKYADTIGIISFQFYDDSSYIYYKNELSRFSNFHSSINSIAFNFRAPDSKEDGLEYLISQPLIGGLTEKQLENTASKNYKKIYRLYFYCIINSSGKLTDLSSLFK